MGRSIFHRDILTRADLRSVSKYKLASRQSRSISPGIQWADASSLFIKGDQVRYTQSTHQSPHSRLGINKLSKVAFNCKDVAQCIFRSFLVSSDPLRADVG